MSTPRENCCCYVPSFILSFLVLFAFSCFSRTVALPPAPSSTSSARCATSMAIFAVKVHRSRRRVVAISVSAAVKISGKGGEECPVAADDVVVARNGLAAADLTPLLLDNPRNFISASSSSSTFYFLFFLLPSFHFESVPAYSLSFNRIVCSAVSLTDLSIHLPPIPSSLLRRQKHTILHPHPRFASVCFQCWSPDEPQKSLCATIVTRGVPPRTMTAR